MNLESLIKKVDILKTYNPSLEELNRCILSDILFAYQETGWKNVEKITDEGCLAFAKDLYNYTLEKKIFGLLNVEEACWLNCLVNSIKNPAKILEVGTYMGFSTIFLSKLQDKNRKLFGSPKIWTLDNNFSVKLNEYDFGLLSMFYNLDLKEKISRNFTRLDHCHRNWSEMKVMDNILTINRDSGLAKDDVPDDLDLLFIDGDHDYLPVKKDIEIYYPKLKSSGKIVFHDFNGECGGVEMAVSDFYLSEKANLSEPYLVNSLIWFEKR